MTGPLTPERKQGIRERIEKVPVGEKRTHRIGAGAQIPPAVVNTYRDEQGRRCTAFLATFDSTTEDNVANAVWLAESFTDLPDLFESHEALVEALQRVRGWLGAGSRADEEVAIGILDSALRNAGVTV